MFGKRGQVTIFIIIAIVIVIAGVLAFLFVPGVRQAFVIEEDPQQFLENCISPELEEKLPIIMSQGGSLDPELFILYQDIKVEYLCYTQEYLQQCIMQKPLLELSIEQEIENSIRDKVQECSEDLKNNLEGGGNIVNINSNDFFVELLPGRVRIVIDADVSIQRGEAVARYENFKVDYRTNLYDLVAITRSILNWEARYGNSETTAYMSFYPHVKVEKLKQGDGSTIYILSDRNIGEKFMFATRSIAWPPGYGINYIR
jgi:hypothetical protein